MEINRPDIEATYAQVPWRAAVMNTPSWHKMCHLR
jgi:hypothetical protein